MCHHSSLPCPQNCCALEAVHVRYWFRSDPIITERYCLICKAIEALSSFPADVTGSPCRLPSCFPPLSGIPGGLTGDETPMFVYFTFDDAVTEWSDTFFRRFFRSERKNPNGCPIRATHFNSDGSTDYSIVKRLYEEGHEIGSHSVTHRVPQTWWKEASLTDWKREIQGQRKNIHRKAGIPMEDIRGSRAPFLQLGGDTQFHMLTEEGFTYDASMSAQTNPPTWPFTLQSHDQLYHQSRVLDSSLCSIKPCPTQMYPLWEVPLNILHMDSSHTPRCTMVDGCRPQSKEEALRFLWQNFHRHSSADTKPPFGVNMHTAWFAWPHNADAMDEFIGELSQMDNVWIVPIANLLRWIQSPTPTFRMNSFKPFQCDKFY